MLLPLPLPHLHLLPGLPFTFLRTVPLNYVFHLPHTSWNGVGAALGAAEPATMQRYAGTRRYVVNARAKGMWDLIALPTS